MAITTEDDAEPSDVQHRRPCHDCPWRRTALPGWLGSRTAAEWIGVAHGDDPIYCHTVIGPQCAGAAIYRANVCKLSRNEDVLRLPKDRDTVFDRPDDFKRYHTEDE